MVPKPLLSRLNLKGEDVIIVVMQRLHVDDLVGVLLEQGGWHHLNLPAIADAPQVIPIGKRKVHRRKLDDVLDPVREPRHVLEELKARMGLMDFSAQYLQRPIPAEGNLIKREWLKTYRTPPQPQPLDTFVISWDTAMKASEIADYSVGTVWHVQGDNCYLLDLIRNRFDFPENQNDCGSSPVDNSCHLERARPFQQSNPRSRLPSWRCPN